MRRGMTALFIGFATVAAVSLLFRRLDDKKRPVRQPLKSAPYEYGL